ncbi:recombination-associated protein RdgC [uncultured Amphritea sp.]|uniref:recombination-associated protein RdgC n=1 Tax=uncultured Amphritea sp. TaxID=981605 RepID=UPI002604CD06|nr:recombination-associated protein RdgC [uncultured Amphritea sp.]
MFFKNAIFYRQTSPIGDNFPVALEDKLFTPCSSQELSRVGWVPPADLFDEPFRTIDGATLICMQKEEKIIPSSVIRQALDTRVKLIEDEQARKVYKKEKDQLRDEIILDLLPRAFSKFKRTHAMILSTGWVIVDASSHKQAEELLSHLRSLLGSLPIVLPDVNNSPSAVMTHWLSDAASRPAGFVPLDQSELKDSTAEAGVIRCTGQDLESEEIAGHLTAGKRVTKLAIEWQEALNFTLTDDLTIKRLRLSDQLKEEMDGLELDEAHQQFDAELLRMNREFDRLLQAIMEAFGGEVTRLPKQTTA